MKSDSSNHAEIEQFLRYVFAPGDIAEMRVMHRDGVVSGRFDDVAQLAHQAAYWDGEPGVKAIYYTLNTLDPAKAKYIGHWQMNLMKSKARSTRDIDVLRRNLYLVDIDVERPSGTSSTDEEKAQAFVLAEKVRDYLTDQGFPEPIVMDSATATRCSTRAAVATRGIPAGSTR